MRRPWPGAILYLVFKPQFDAIKSIQPSPSKSPAVTPFHQPAKRERGEGRRESDVSSSLFPLPSPFFPVTSGSHGESFPWSFRKIFTGPHSHASTSSG